MFCCLLFSQITEHDSGISHESKHWKQALCSSETCLLGQTLSVETYHILFYNGNDMYIHKKHVWFWILLIQLLDAAGWDFGRCAGVLSTELGLGSLSINDVWIFQRNVQGAQTCFLKFPLKIWTKQTPIETNKPFEGGFSRCLIIHLLLDRHSKAMLTSHLKQRLLSMEMLDVSIKLLWLHSIPLLWKSQEWSSQGLSHLCLQDPWNTS